MVPTPERLEDSVGEAQHQDVLDRFLAEKVIDAIDLLFGQDLEDLRVKSLSRCKIVSKRLFDDHPSPRSLGLSGKPGAAELLDDQTKEPVGDRQIEQHVGRAVLPFLLIGQQLSEVTEGVGCSKVAAHVMHATDEP